MHYGLRVNSELKGPTDREIKEGRGIALSFSKSLARLALLADCYLTFSLTRRLVPG